MLFKGVLISFCPLRTPYSMRFYTFFAFFTSPFLQRQVLLLGKYEGYMLCTDLDGTFTQPSPSGDDGVYVSRENVDAVESFKAGGGNFTYSTGRRPWYIKENIFPFVTPNAPMITVNGASIYDHQTDRILRSVFLEREALSGPLEAYRFFADVIEEVYAVAEKEEFCLSFREKNFEEKFKSIISLHEDWYKFVFRCVDGESTLKLQEFFRNKYSHICDVPRSWPTGQEILSENATKGQRVLEVKQMFPQVHTLICVGDFENDISMIKAADKGYAVANAIDSVLKEADYVTVSNTDSAIAKIISEI